MRRWSFAAGLCLVVGMSPALWADWSSILPGTTSAKPMKFKQIDTSKAIAPVPTYGQPKKGFSLKSLVPGWLRSNDSPAQPTSMKALKRSNTQSANSSPSNAFHPVLPSASEK